jgi:hypothetical protein
MNIIETPRHFVNPYTGKIYNKQSKRFCGAKDKDDYLLFKLDGKMYKNHRFIYEQHYNVKLTPQQQINHINHKRADNRIDNLEVVSGQQNSQWRNKQKNNTSGYKGVYLTSNKWAAKIKYNNKSIHIGYFDNIEDARHAYNTKAKYLNENHNCHYKMS